MEALRNTRSLSRPLPGNGASPLELHQAYLENICFLLNLTRRLGVREEQDQEDIAHEVFVLAVEKAEEYDETRGTLRAWLAGIAIHRAKRWRDRARNRLDHTGEIESERDPRRNQEERTAAAELQKIAHDLIDELPEELRLPLQLIEFDGFSHEEAANALDLPLSTTSDRYYRAKREFQKKIDRLRAKKRLTGDDVLALVIPPDVAGMFDALRTSDLAVDSRTADRIWNRVRSEPLQENDNPPASAAAPTSNAPNPPLPSGGAANANGRSSAHPRTQPRQASPQPSTQPPNHPTLPTPSAFTGGAKILGGVLALAAAAVAGAALQANLTKPTEGHTVAVAESSSPTAVGSAATSVPTSGAAPADQTPATSGQPAASSNFANGPSNPADSELNIMTRMRAALHSRPADVLPLAAKHTRLYPNKNAQEREVLTILALARTGNRAEAQARAKAFKARSPQSAYVKTLEAEVGATP